MSGIVKWEVEPLEEDERLSETIPYNHCTTNISVVSADTFSENSLIMGRLYAKTTVLNDLEPPSQMKMLVLSSL